MTTQTIKFRAVSLRELPTLTLSVKLQSASATVATLASITEDATINGLYTGTVEDVAAGTYAVQRSFNGVTVDDGTYQVDLLLAVGTYEAVNRIDLINSPNKSAVDAIQQEILAAIQGTEVIQVASPNVQGNLVLTQGDDYDGVANPRAQWTVSTDYTTGWTVRLTIRDVDDALVYTNTGSVVSVTVVAVTIAAPTGLTMTGCPGQWHGKFDVELTHSSGAKKTIALGVCYINEDQTRG
jgi:hypothetical protein